MRLFDRRYTLVVGTLDVSALDFQFKVKRTLAATPNFADIRIYGLSEAHRKQLEGPLGQGVSGKKHKGPKGEPKAIAAKPVPVRIEAGYKERVAQIYLGEVRSAQSRFEGDGEEIMTELNTGDGVKEIQAARINVPIGPGATVDVAMNALVKALGLGAGNSSKAIANLKASGVTTLHPHGGVLSGSAADHMTDFCRSAGLEWSVQDGNIQILNVGLPLNDTQAVQISSDTGMVGFPVLDSAGFVNFVSLMNPDLKPGVKVSVESKFINGGFRLTECEYHGETYGDAWYVKCTGKKY